MKDSKMIAYNAINVAIYMKQRHNKSIMNVHMYLNKKKKEKEKKEKKFNNNTKHNCSFKIIT